MSEKSIVRLKPSASWLSSRSSSVPPITHDASMVSALVHAQRSLSWARKGPCPHAPARVCHSLLRLFSGTLDESSHPSRSPSIPALSVAPGGHCSPSAVHTLGLSSCWC
eukprot:scaffold277083_cov28-Tisochrysis_lutea.AAC.2